MVLDHTVYVPVPQLTVPTWAQDIVRMGGSGVELFFVISAFSLFYTMPLRLAKQKPTLSFYIHRFFRIAPLFYVILLWTVIRDHHLFRVTPSLKDVLTNIFFIFNLDPKGQSGLPWAGWTIGVEMMFYVVFPLVYAKVRSIYGAACLFIGCILLWHLIQVLLFYSPLSAENVVSMQQRFVFLYLPIFSCGAICFFALKKHLHEGVTKVKPEIGLLILLSGALLFMGLMHSWLPNIFGNGLYWEGPIYAMLTIGLCFFPLRLFVNRFMVHMGQISYSLYLIHPSVVYFLIPVYRSIYKTIPTTSLDLLLCYAITLAILIPIAEVSFRLIEKPGIKLGSKVYKALVKSDRAPSMEAVVEAKHSRREAGNFIRAPQDRASASRESQS
ncbi:acyltransferase [Dyella flava]|nr:acyltransferase [Dyella flava]